jgi:hypothetical protein
MAEKEGKYVPAGGQGLGTLYVVDEASPGLRELARILPEQFGRALGKAGSILRARIRAAMEAGGTPGERWEPVVNWRRDAPARAARRGKRKRRKKASRYSAAAARFFRMKFFGREGNRKPYGRLYSAGRYLLDKERLIVQAGWVNASAASPGKAVQAGLRGEKNSWSHDGSQPVTRAMRRALAAAGLILSQSKRALRQPGRTLMRNIYNDFLPEIPDVIALHTAKALARST